MFKILEYRDLLNIVLEISTGFYEGIVPSAYFNWEVVIQCSEYLNVIHTWHIIIWFCKGAIDVGAQEDCFVPFSCLYVWAIYVGH